MTCTTVLHQSQRQVSVLLWPRSCAERHGTSPKNEQERHS